MICITFSNYACVSQCCKCIVSAYLSSRTKWKWTCIWACMCLLWSCIIRFFESLIAKVLSQQIIINSSWFIHSFPNTFFNYTAWRALVATIISFAFVVDKLPITFLMTMIILLNLVKTFDPKCFFYFSYHQHSWCRCKQ